MGDYPKAQVRENPVAWEFLSPLEALAESSRSCEIFQIGLSHNQANATAPTFWEFVFYLLATNVAKYNSHWLPIHLLCCPCSLPFAILTKSETIERDNRKYFFTSLSSQLFCSGFQIHQGDTGVCGGRDSKWTNQWWHSIHHLPKILLWTEKKRGRRTDSEVSDWPRDVGLLVRAISWADNIVYVLRFN